MDQSSLKNSPKSSLHYGKKTGKELIPEHTNEKINDFFKSRNWKAFPFQNKTWKAYREGKSGLVHAPTGTGKTYAVWVPPLL